MKNKHQTPEEKAAWKAAQRTKLMCRAYKTGVNPAQFNPKPISKEKLRRFILRSK